MKLIKLRIIAILLIFQSCTFLPPLDRTFLDINLLLILFRNTLSGKQPLFFIGGNVTGLSGQGLTISLETTSTQNPSLSTQTLSIVSSGVFRFGGLYPSGTSYRILTVTQPTNPIQICAVHSGQGTIINGSVDFVQIVCEADSSIPQNPIDPPPEPQPQPEPNPPPPPASLVISGTVNGLLGSGLQLSNSSNAGNQTIAIGATSFAFNPILEGSTYDLQIASQPTNPSQICSITSPSVHAGILASPGLSIVVDCTASAYPVSVVVNGIGPLGTLTTGQELQVSLSPSGQTLSFSGDTNLTFPVNQSSGSTLTLTILNPDGAIANGFCSIAQPNFTLTNASHLFSVSCSQNPSVSGTITNPGGSASSVLGSNAKLSLIHVGGPVFSNQAVFLNPGDTNFTFPNSIPYNAQFQVVVDSHPAAPSQICQLTGTGVGSSATITSNVADLVLNCSLPQPVVTTASGISPAPIDVALSGLLSGAEFRYTLGDGTSGQPDPNCSSPDTTTTTIPMSNHTVPYIKLIQCRAGWVSSAITTAGPYHFQVATPTPSTSSGISLNFNSTVSFASPSTPDSWTCYTQATHPTAPTAPVCGGTVNTCAVGSLGSFTMNQSIGQNVQVIGCRSNFLASNAIDLSYPIQSYVVSGTVSGLPGSFGLDTFQIQLTPSVGSPSSFPVAVNGGFAFGGNPVPSGATYSVAVLSHPQNPWYTCTVANGSGTVTNSDITNVSISCTPNQYSVTGTVTGPSSGNLLPGTSLTLSTPTGSVTLLPGESLNQTLSSGTAFDYSITLQPAGQVCNFTNPPGTLGTIAGESIGNMNIHCVSGNFVGGNNLITIPPRPLNYHLFQASTVGMPTIGNPTLTGNTNATGASARFTDPRGIAIAGDFAYIADATNHKIRRLHLPTSSVTDLAGSGTSGTLDGVGTSARFAGPHGIATDGTFVYVADAHSCLIRRIEISSANVVTIAGNGSCAHVGGTGLSAGFLGVHGMAVRGHSLYIAERHAHTIRQMDLRTGVVTTLVGQPGVEGNVDGIGTSARLRFPIGMVIIGNYLYFHGVNNIRRLDLSNNNVSTIAGSTTDSLSGQIDGIGTEARFNIISGMTTDGTDLYISQSGNLALRKIQLSDLSVTTLAGGTPVTGTVGGTGGNARFTHPLTIANNGKTLFIIDEHSVRYIQNLGLTFHYPLSGNLFDYSSATIPHTTGTWYGGEQYAVGRRNEANGSAEFTGSNWVSTKPFPISTSNSFSLSAWVRPGVWNTLQGILSGSSVKRYDLMIQRNPTTLSTQIIFRSFNAGGSIKTVAQAEVTNLQLGKWHHIVVRFDRDKWDSAGNYGGEIFLNGVPITSLTRDYIPGEPIASSAGEPVQIGGNFHHGVNFQGRLAEIQLYDRAISDGEIHTLGQDALATEVYSNSLSTGAKGLIAHYNFSLGLRTDRATTGYALNSLIGGSPVMMPGKDGDTNGSLDTSGGRYENSTMITALPGGNHPRTVCAWLHPKSYPNTDGAGAVAVSYGMGAVNQSFGIGLLFSGGANHVGVLANGANYTTAHTIPLHTWSHLCATYGISAISLYVNGNKIASDLNASGINTLTTDVGARIQLGQMIGGSHIFQGRVDEIRIYNHILTGMQIRQLASQIPEGLVARYDFTGDAKDVSGFSNDMDVFGSPVLSADRHGNSSLSYRFNGSTSFLERSGTNLPLPTTNSDRTICAWVRADQTNMTGVRIAVAYGAASSGQAVQLGLNSLDASPTVLGCQFGGPCSLSRYNPYTWSHICNVVSNSQHNLYANGRLLTTQDAAGFSTPNTLIQIGKLGSQYFFPGSIDDVLVYNRALTGPEIQALSGHHYMQIPNYHPSVASTSLGLALQADSFSYLTDTEAISSGWRDASGRDNHLSTVSGTGVYYQSQGMNGKPTVSFVTAESGYFARAVPSTGLNSSHLNIFFVSLTPNPHHYTLFYGGSGVGMAELYFPELNAQLDFVDASGLIVRTQTGYLNYNTPFIGGFVFNGTISPPASVYKQGGMFSLVTNASGTNFSLNNYTIYLGSSFNSFAFFNGSLSEILVFTDTMTPQAINKVHCYLSSKYNIPLDPTVNCQ